MAQLPEAFDPNSITPNEPGSGRSLPASDENGHVVKIIASDWKTVKDNDKHGRLVLTLKILEGPHTGEEGDYGLNLINSNPKAVEIAKKELSALCHVVGVFNLVNDSSVLHERPFRALVRQQKNDPQFTEVYGVKTVDGLTPLDVKKLGPQGLSGPPAGGPPSPAAVPPPAPQQPGQAPPPAPTAPAQPGVPPAPQAPPTPAAPPPAAPTMPQAQPAPQAPAPAPVAAPQAPAPAPAAPPAAPPPAAPPAAPAPQPAGTEPWNQPPPVQ